MKVAVVGLGYWGPNHVRNLVSLEACTEILAIDVDLAKAQRVATAHSSITAADDIEIALRDPEVRAIVVSTPVFSHADLARRALQAGKSVLVEKPLATSVRVGAELVELATSKGTLITAGHTFLFSPPVVAVREMIAAGELGELLYLQGSRVNLGIHNSDVSVLWDLAPHDLSILLDWVPERPTRVSTSGRSSHRGHPPDVAFLDVAFPSGFVANLHLSWLAPTKIRRMTLVGDRKMVVYEDTHSDEPVKVYDKGVSLPDPKDFGEYQLAYRTGDIVSPRVPVWEPLGRELAEFLNRVAAGETPDAREQRVLDVIAIIEAAETSLVAGGQPVDL